MYKMLSFSPIEKEGCNVSVSPPPIKPQFASKHTPSTSSNQTLKRKCSLDGTYGYDGYDSLPQSKKINN